MVSQVEQHPCQREAHHGEHNCSNEERKQKQRPIHHREVNVYMQEQHANRGGDHHSNCGDQETGNATPQ